MAADRDMNAAKERGPGAAGSENAAPGRIEVFPGPPEAASREEVESVRLRRQQAFAELIMATGVVLTLCYYAKLILIILLVSILLSFILAPLVELLERLRVPRSVAALAAVLLLPLALYLVTYFSYAQAVNFFHELPRYSGRIHEAIAKFEQRAEDFQHTTETVLPKSKQDQNVQKVQVQSSSSWTELLTSQFGSVTEFVLVLSFIPFLVYFMLTWQQHVRSATVMLFRMENRNTAYVTLGLISSMIRAFLVGNLLVGLFLAAASTIVFGVLQLPYFYFLGVISGFLSLIPYLGVLLAVVPPLVAGIGQIHSAQVLAIVITVVGLHLVAINVLYPKYLGRRLQLNPLAVSLALLFWGWLWGAMGLILAIPITGAVKVVFDHVEPLRAFGAWLGE